MFSRPTFIPALAVCAAAAALAVSPTGAVPLAAPFDTAPSQASPAGVASSNNQGMFVENGNADRRYFLGVSDNPNLAPGSLTLDFDQPFEDGPGDDFAILTNGTSWGNQADTALFEFFLGGALQTSFSASLAPDQLFTFDLPGTGVQADRVVITNTAPVPTGSSAAMID